MRISFGNVVDGSILSQAFSIVLVTRSKGTFVNGLTKSNYTKI